MGELPTGTVTFLFTDIEGSTRLLDDLGPNAYSEALADHQRIVRAALGDHRGVEVDTQGDAFFCVFSSARDGVAAIAEIQQQLTGPICVRAGLHSGEALLHEGRYIGTDVHRAARVAAIGHGGQTVLSAATAGLLQPGAIELRDLGEHRLKDLTAPVRLYQLGPDDFPPLRSLYRTNLPVAAWPLLGRDRELEEIRALVADNARLVTLTGPGGSGKTRLALQAAADLTDEFPGGSFFVALAPLRDPSAVLSAVAEAVGMRPDDDVTTWLSSRQALLVLDNLEHLSGMDAVVKQLLIAETVVIATSRAPLHLSTERELAVEPLPDDAAIELFIARAAAAGRHVEADDAVAEVCRRLDNLPLALELAAARAKLLSPAMLLQRLDAVLPLLTGGARDLPERQRTLRATIEWSHDLLEPDERTAFRRLSVFRGSFTLEAAEATTGADLDRFAALLDQSLLKPLGDDRFFMLETIREYAREQLDRAGESPGYKLRHADYYASLSEGLRQRDGAEAERVLIAEVSEIRAALAYAQAQDDAETQLRLLTAAGRVFRAGSQHDYGEALKAALQQPTADVVLRGKAEGRLGFLEYRRGDYPAALEAAQRALRLGEQSGDSAVTTEALDMLGILAVADGDLVRARELHERVLELQLAANDRPGAASTLVNLGDVALVAGEYERAIELNTEAMELARAHGGSALSLRSR